MPPAITVKRPSIMTVASMKKRPIMLTRRPDTPSMPESTLKVRERLTLRNMERNNRRGLVQGKLRPIRNQSSEVVAAVFDDLVTQITEPRLGGVFVGPSFYYQRWA
jgi:hypothetical protein